MSATQPVLLVLLLGLAVGCGGGTPAPAGGALDCPTAPGPPDVVAPDVVEHDVAAPDDVGPDGGASDLGADRPPVDASAPTAPSATEWLFDEDAPPREIRIEIAPEDWAWLNANATREEYVPGAVELAGERFARAAIRYKGAYGSLHSCFTQEGVRTCPKLSLKVSFNRYDGSGRFFGVRKFILNSCNRDDSCLRERLAYAMFRRAGVEASRAVHVSVRVNDEPASYYLLVEEIDHEFLEDHFGDPTGNLYKEVWPQYDTPDPYRAALRTNEDDGDVSRLVALANRVRETDVVAAPEALDPWIDRDVMARYFVVDQLTNNWDGIWKFYCSGAYCGNHNFFLYEDPAAGKVVVIPWDLDHCFGRPNRDMARSWWEDGPEVCEIQQVNAWTGVRAPQCDPLLRGLMRGDWGRYQASLQALIAGAEAPLTVEKALALLDHYRAQLWPLVEADPAGPGLAVWRNAVAELRQILLAQYQAAHGLGSDPPT